MARSIRASDRTEDFPWWLVLTGAIGCWLAYRIFIDSLYREIFTVIVKGVGVTAFVTLTAFSLASVLGLLLALALLSRFLLLRQFTRFYVEIIRGIPMLVLLFYIAFVGAPALVGALNLFAEPLGLDPMSVRDIPLLWRAILALTIGYSAFIAEVFRAGIQAVGAGQIEAAKVYAAGSFRFFETYNVVAYVYLLVTLGLSLLLRRLEARLQRRGNTLC